MESRVAEVKADKLEDTPVDKERPVDDDVHVPVAME